jgi:hypothetical protein
MTKSHRLKGFAILVLVLSLLPLGLLVQPVAADNTDFANFDFAAADHATYNHKTGGGAYNDGKASSVREELEATSFQCGDIVTFLTEVDVNATTVDPVQTIDLYYSFTAGTTGQQGVAFVDIVSAKVNYGLVENGDDYLGTPGGAGVLGLDSGISDDRQNAIDGDLGVGGSTATLISETIPDPLFTKGAEVLGTVQLDDLEPGEHVIVRVDVRIACQPGDKKPSGNLHGALLDALTVFPDTSGSSIPGAGVQTVPFKQVEKIQPPPSAVDLASFTATAGRQGIVVEWETVSEVDNVGFNLYRAESAEGPRTQLNAGLIRSLLPPGSAEGASYLFLDESARPGVTYSYWLEDVDVYGVSTFHGPVSATLARVGRLLPNRPRPGLILPFGR